MAADTRRVITPSQVVPLGQLRHRLVDDEAGISLVEVLVAIVILGVVLGAMARTLTTSLIGVQLQERQVQATALMQETLEQVNGVEWEDAGLCESAAQAHFGTPSTYVYPDGPEEDVVVLADSDATCAGTPLLVPERTVTREGVPYVVETVVTWSDDPGDDVSGTDPNSPQDVKHVLVAVSWDQRGENLSVENQTYIAPNALEQPVRTQVEHTTGFTYTYLTTADSLTKTDVYLRAFTVTPQSGITVTWTKADGTSVGPQAMVNSSGDGLTWQLLIPNGSPEYTINHLPNGETLFTFTAEDAATADTTVVLDRGLFLFEPSGHVVTSSTLPSTIRVKDGVACTFDLRLTVQGALTSDLVSANWTNGPTETALTAIGSTATGATFEATFSGATGFAAGTTDLTIDAVRIADSHVATLTDSIAVVALGEDETC